MLAARKYQSQSERQESTSQKSSVFLSVARSASALTQMRYFVGHGYCGSIWQDRFPRFYLRFVSNALYGLVNHYSTQEFTYIYRKGISAPYFDKPASTRRQFQSLVSKDLRFGPAFILPPDYLGLVWATMRRASDYLTSLHYTDKLRQSDLLYLFAVGLASLVSRRSYPGILNTP